jgi:hypothetical protein
MHPTQTQRPDNAQHTHTCLFAELPEGVCNQLIPSHVEGMITGTVRLTQNRKGVVTIHYEGGHKKALPMSDFELMHAEGYMRAFQTAWKRAEGLG